MPTFEEFIADVERGEARRHDEGGKYDIGEGVLRALHERVSALEEKASRSQQPVKDA